MTKFKSYRDESRTNWGRNVEDDASLSREDLAFGAQLRAADALEKMAEPYVRLLNRVEYLEREERRMNEENARLWRRINSLRGVITRLKRAAAAMKDAA